jgi:hypothetical protein
VILADVRGSQQPFKPIGQKKIPLKREVSFRGESHLADYSDAGVVSVKNYRTKIISKAKANIR